MTIEEYFEKNVIGNFFTSQPIDHYGIGISLQPVKDDYTHVQKKSLRNSGKDSNVRADDNDCSVATCKHRFVYAKECDVVTCKEIFVCAKDLTYHILKNHISKE